MLKYWTLGLTSDKFVFTASTECVKSENDAHMSRAATVLGSYFWEALLWVIWRFDQKSKSIQEKGAAKFWSL